MCMQYVPFIVITKIRFLSINHITGTGKSNKPGFNFKKLEVLFNDFSNLANKNQ